MAQTKEAQSNEQAPMDWEKLSEMTAEVMKEGQKFWSDYWSQMGSMESMGMGTSQGIGEALQEAMMQWLANPQQLLESQATLWQDYFNLWQRTLLQAVEGNEHIAPLIEPQPGDRRFKHEDWKDVPAFNFIKQAYLLTADHIHKLVSELESLDEKTSQKLAFYTRQYVAALSPTNFIATNPEVLRLTLESKGENLVKGMKNLVEDLERGEGQLNIKMTDLDAFEVGENLATTPGQVVFENEMMQLIQYAPTTPNVNERPVLIVPPWINKFYILDLQPKNSFIQYALDQGLTVFLISWVNPNEKHREKDFADYMFDGTIAAVDAIEKTLEVDGVNTIGYCIGGSLLGMTLAYMAEKKDTRIKSATYFTTLLDFSEPGELSVFIDDEQVSALEESMEEKGYLSGRQMAMSFNMLRENDLIWTYFINNYLCGKEPFPFDLLYWNCDSTNMPAKMHSSYLRKMYLENRLCQPGGMTINDTQIDLRKIKIPTFFLSAEQDHIAPWKSTYAGALLHQGDVHFVLGGSGHVAGVINPPHKHKYGYWTCDGLPKTPERWMKEAKQHEGSWWPHWAEWVRQYSGKEITARDPEKGQLKAIEPAPGRYVKEKI